MKKKLTSLFIFASLTSLLFACNNGGGGNKPSPEPEPEVVTNKYIVRNSRSDYSVVIPKKAKDKERIAAEKLVTYLSYSSGARLNIITDNEVVKGSHYISLGNTTVFNSNFSNVSMKELDNKISSYFISTKDDCLYIYSNPNERGEGTLYGAYDLLHDLINYECYATDEIYYTQEETINLIEYKNIFVHPTFDGRSIGNFHLNYDQDSCDSLRTINQYRGTEWVSDIYGHSQVTSFVKPNDTDEQGRKLYVAHPDWFTNPSPYATTTNCQLCWSAGESLETYVANRFIYYFQAYPNATYFMFGQEDNNTAFCTCDKCTHAMETYAMNYAGLQIIFMNHVIEKTSAWLAEHQPDRQVRYVVFAYYGTAQAPCIKSGDTWKPYNDQVVPNKDLYFLYAPISCSFAYPIDNNNFNSDVHLELKQWSAVASGKLMIYLYDVNFRHYFVNFLNFSTAKSMYQTCKDLGVSYMYTQGATDTNTTCFPTMREYVESKLMWNINVSYDSLVRDFMEHYFREAANELYEYYATVRDRLTAYHAMNQDGGSIYADVANEEIYPYSVLRYFTTLFKTAMEKIDGHRETNPSLYSSLKARIMREYLSVIYLKMTLAPSEISDEEKAEMKDIFITYTGYFGITKTYEGGDLIDVDSLFA